MESSDLNTKLEVMKGMNSLAILEATTDEFRAACFIVVAGRRGSLDVVYRLAHIFSRYSLHILRGSLLIYLVVCEHLSPSMTFTSS